MLTTRQEIRTIKIHLFIRQLLQPWQLPRYYMGYMNTEVTLQISSTSSNETELLGEKIGQNLKGSEVIELVSDLGGGKTAFVRGLAKGADSTDNVASPSFTIKREYHTSDFMIHHFDFYRLREAGVVKHELEESLGDAKVVTVIEWADIVEGVLPNQRLTVSIKTTGETTRQFTFELPETLSYLVQDLK